MMNAKLGLIDVDGHNYPNLALMKLSAWHKAHGWSVEWYTPFEEYELVYKSKVFSFTPDYTDVINSYRIISGGTGYAIKGAGGEHYDPQLDKPLAEEVEHIRPDYSIYGIKDTAYGYLTRGCPRGCSFCIVAKKEGKCSRKVADLSEFWNGQRNIVLNDPNILACPQRDELIGQLVASRAWVDFNQWLDARMVTDDGIAQRLSAVKTKEIHFAWDRIDDEDAVLRGLRLFAKYSNKPHSHNAIVYVLTNHGTTIGQDLYRIYTLRALGYWAYVMIYDKEHASADHRRMARWCNNRFIFSQCPNFEDYGNKNIQDPKQLKFFS